MRTWYVLLLFSIYLMYFSTFYLFIFYIVFISLKAALLGNCKSFVKHICVNNFFTATKICLEKAKRARRAHPIVAGGQKVEHAVRDLQ